jgi:hypothetical protein
MGTRASAECIVRCTCVDLAALQRQSQCKPHTNTFNLHDGISLSLRPSTGSLDVCSVFFACRLSRVISVRFGTVHCCPMRKISPHCTGFRCHSSSY